MMQDAAGVLEGVEFALVGGDGDLLGAEFGLACRSRARAPETWGAACDVPAKPATPPPMPEELMAAPGASRSIALLLFEKQAILSADVEPSVQPKLMVPTFPSYTAPTPMAFEMHAGAPISPLLAELPADPTVRVPRARRAPTAWVRASVNDDA